MAEQEAHVEPWSFLRAVSQRAMEVGCMPSRKQAGCGIILGYNEKVGFRERSPGCGDQKRLGGRDL